MNKNSSNQSQEHRDVPSAESQATSELNAALKQYAAPWQYELSDRLSDDSDCLSISDANGSSIAEMQCPQDIEEPLARLMTAAPALYEALKATPCRYSRSRECSLNVVDMCDRCAALALATKP